MTALVLDTRPARTGIVAAHLGNIGRRRGLTISPDSTFAIPEPPLPFLQGSFSHVERHLALLQTVFERGQEYGPTIGVVNDEFDVSGPAGEGWVFGDVERVKESAIG